MAIAASGKTDDDIMAILQGIAANSGTAGGGGRVYMGEWSPTRPKGSSNQAWKNMQGEPGDRSKWMSTDEAINEYYTWSMKQQKSFVDQAILAGLLDIGDGPLEGGKIWEKFVKEAAKYGKAGKKVSPVDLMASYVKASGGANAWVQRGAFEFNTQTGESRYVGPGTYLGGGRAQMTDTRVDLTDPDTARSVATRLFQDMMGRDPGAGELKAFADALHMAEQNNPVVSTTTTQYDMETGQQLSSATTQSGGVSAEGKAYIGEQQIKKKKEYGVTQAVTTYQNAFEGLIYGAPE